MNTNYDELIEEAAKALYYAEQSAGGLKWEEASDSYREYVRKKIRAILPTIEKHILANWWAS